ncbi:MAG: hypothetical protein JRF06_06585 [Deltaproteobacteria bacterium]|nr:hypothetical protein [Deltaproteobacteria bacterium]
MRAIEFRGKRVDNGEMVYGDLKHYNEQLLISVVDPENIEDTGDVFDVDPETVGQFTGLTDKNGVRIFEGDIITPCESHRMYAKIVGIDKFGLYLENISDIKNRDWKETRQRPALSWWDRFKEELLIISNVHQNPELLKEKCDE